MCSHVIKNLEGVLFNNKTEQNTILSFQISFSNIQTLIEIKFTKQAGYFCNIQHCLHSTDERKTLRVGLLTMFVNVETHGAMRLRTL